MTYRELCRYGEAFLNESDIKDYKMDAWLLMGYVTGFDRTAYFMRADEAIEENQKAKYLELLRQRGKRIPLQHLTKEQEFMGLKFKVNEHVLIPRQDTEILVDTAITVLEKKMQEKALKGQISKEDMNLTVLDMCTGSGCIPISIEKMLEQTYGANKLSLAMGVDISAKALQVARENGAMLKAKTKWTKSDLFTEVEGTFDVITSNPPYIRTAVIEELEEEVRLHDPRIALDGKEDGLYFYRRIVNECVPFLKENGWILFEIGHDQAEDVSAVLRQNGFTHIGVKKDLAGLDRVVFAMYNSQEK